MIRDVHLPLEPLRDELLCGQGGIMLADGLFVNMDVYSALFVSGLGVIYHCWDSSVVASSGLPSPLGLGPHWLGPYCE